MSFMVKYFASYFDLVLKSIAKNLKSYDVSLKKY